MFPQLNQRIQDALAQLEVQLVRRHDFTRFHIWAQVLSTFRKRTRKQEPKLPQMRLLLRRKLSRKRRKQSERQRFETMLFSMILMPWVSILTPMPFHRNAILF